MIARSQKARDRLIESLYGMTLYPYQREFSDMIIHNAFMRNGEEGNDEIARQAGKSLSFVLTECFLAPFNDKLYGDETVEVGFFAPRLEQVKTTFDKMKDYLPVVAQAFGMHFIEANQRTLVLTRDNPNRRSQYHAKYKKAYIAYAMTLGETSRAESKTLHRAYVDEAQDVIDFKVNKEVKPMLAATGGNLYRIGVAGYQNCDFKKAVDSGENAIICDAKRVIKDRRKVYKITGDPKHLLYEKYVEQQIQKAGSDEVDYIQTQFNLVWIVEKGSLITRPKLEKCKKKFLCVGEPIISIGVDLAKKSDSTVATACTKLGQRLCSIELRGHNYQEQYPEICAFAQKLVNMGYRIDVIRPDTTGSTGDAAGEALEAHPDCHWNVEFFYFAPQNKHNLYQNFINLLEVGAGITDGTIEDVGQRRFEYWEGDKNADRFEQQMCDMIKEYKGAEGNMLSCHHPETAGSKDDHCDATAMSVWEAPDSEDELGFILFD